MAYVRSRKTAEGVCWYLTRRLASGKTKTERLGVIHRDAARAAARAQNERDGTRARPEAIAARTALGRFLRHWKNVKRRERGTLRFYRSHLGPLFLFLAELAPMRAWSERLFEDYVSSHPAWSPRTVQMVATAARTFAKWARRNGYALGPLAADFEGPRVVQATKEAYGAEEARALLEASRGHRLELAVHAGLYAGLSHGDIERLTPQAARGGWLERARAKTGKPLLIPLARPLAARLASGPFRTLPPGSRPWASLCLRAGVPSRGGLKRLRHTFATLLDAAHVTAGTKDALMGYVPRTMIDRYTHADRERLRLAIQAVERMLAPRSPSAMRRQKSTNAATPQMTSAPVSQSGGEGGSSTSRTSSTGTRSSRDRESVAPSHAISRARDRSRSHTQPASTIASSRATKNP